ncbi:hypothetical protein HZ326_7868 [Fusarium oxysporum f. sp. albedinis]|nr:hypothetical protein HZ326_7868 [Fusarium oxysporum f. sp. albedinis]
MFVFFFKTYVSEQLTQKTSQYQPTYHGEQNAQNFTFSSSRVRTPEQTAFPSVTAISTSKFSSDLSQMAMWLDTYMIQNFTSA